MKIDSVATAGPWRPAHRHRGAGRGRQAHERDQVLLGVTGSGKTFTMAKVIEADPAPGADPRAQQDAGRPALRRVQELLPRQRGRVFRLLLRLLPAGGLRAAHRHLHREGILDQRADRPHAPLGHAGAARARRRHHRRLGLLHLRHRLGRDLHRHDLRAEASASASTSASCSPTSWRCNTSATTPISCAAPSACAATRSSSSRPTRGPRLAHLAVRRRDRIHHRVRPADRPEDRRAGGQGLRQLALRDAQADAEAGGERHQGRAEAAARELTRAGRLLEAQRSSSAPCSTSR
jgi:hypothetical protein